MSVDQCNCLYLLINLKTENYSYQFLLSAFIKGRSQCYGSMHIDVYGHLRTWHMYNTCKTLYMNQSSVPPLHGWTISDAA